MKTRVVAVGQVLIGGDNPIRIQSMVTSEACDIEKTVFQIEKLHAAGCEIARLAIPGKKEAYALELIKKELVKRNILMPLVADVHFYPPAALVAAEFADKVRINPGNYGKNFETEFLPLIEKCRDLKKSIRIGVNHGSLSKETMERYGNTPEGMVASAIEFAKVCIDAGFYEFLFSLKASDPLIMIKANRLMTREMEKRGWDFPMHLGVTEAGEGEEGTIKSAIGIGSLLYDGIGDTIRVSLTQDPWEEIAPGRALAALFPGKAPLLPQLAIRENVRLPTQKLYSEAAGKIVSEDEAEWQKLNKDEPLVILRPHSDPVLAARRFALFLEQKEYHFPVLLGFRYDVNDSIRAAAEMGSVLCDRLAEGVFWEGAPDLPLSILQGCKLHFSKTEFISCPGCGRTLFDIQSVVKEVKARLGGYPGLKIAVMGCVVNGPGEMAGADFGYVGAGRGKVNLYVKSQCVEKDIPASEAVDRLVVLVENYFTV